jgi:hypothetical protein
MKYGTWLDRDQRQVEKEWAATQQPQPQGSQTVNKAKGKRCSEQNRAKSHTLIFESERGKGRTSGEAISG